MIFIYVDKIINVLIDSGLSNRQDAENSIKVINVQVVL